VGWETLARTFDALWGDALWSKEARSLPKYPNVVGGVHARWVDGQNAEHEAVSLDEIKQAYERLETASITFSGLTETGLHRNFHYRPSKVEASVVVEAPDPTTAEQIIKAVSKEFPLIERYVFISYDTAEYDLASLIAKVVKKRMVPGVSIFVAKRDIRAGTNPLKVMLEDRLLHAEALFALCSARSKKSPWLWWESAAVWAKGGLVIPLFVDISPSKFDGPLTLVCQGRSLFDEAELNSALISLVKKLCPDRQYQKLTKKEFAGLEKFQCGSIRKRRK
jgi:hypothetical protein